MSAMEDIYCFLFTAIAIVLVLLNVYASMVVWSSLLFEPKRKILQTIFIWAIPFLGAILAIRLVNEEKYVKKTVAGYQKDSEIQDIFGDGKLGRRSFEERFEDFDGGD